MPLSTLARTAIGRRLRWLEQGLAADLERDAEALHRTRVATRRLREALPLLASAQPAYGADQRDLDAAKRTIRGLTRALGGVRELDVARAIVDELRAAQPTLPAGLAAIRAAIDEERSHRLDELRHRVDVRRLRGVSRLLTGIASRTDEATSRAFGARIPRRARRLKRAVTQAGLVYSVEQLHEVRVAAKKLRYALELAEEVDGRPTSELVRSLKDVQDLLGRLHDLDAVAAIARAVSVDPVEPADVHRDVARILDILEEETHQRHAEYVARRHVLVEVADAGMAIGRRHQP